MNLILFLVLIPNCFTRVIENSKSCIDHNIFSKDFNSSDIKSYVLKSDINDHYKTIFSMNDNIIKIEIVLIGKSK